MSLLSSARFATTVAKHAQLPYAGLPEIAFVGRSNAGKSTGINTLCSRRRLAFASRTPGRTQALNFFVVGPDDAPLAYLVDTPGYGYAQAPKELKNAWDKLAGRYLMDRAPLRAVVVMLDIRRGVTALDEALIGWLPAGTPLLALLTKSDKLGLQEQRKVTRDVAARLQALGVDARIVLFSALSRQGLDEARAIIEAWVRGEEPPPPPQAKKNPGTTDRRGSNASTLAEAPAQGGEAGGAAGNQ